MSEPSFGGLRVVSFESRKAEDMRKLITRYDGVPRVAPSMREVPLADQREALDFAKRLLAGAIDIVVLLTGVGTRTLLKAMAAAYPHEQVLAALQRTTVVVRGPKPIVALVEVGLKPTVSVPEPNTWRDLLATLDTKAPVQGKRVAVQEYGETNEELLSALAARGAEVLRVPVYRWALPEDTAPLREAIAAICAQEADVVLFTSATQVEHALRVAKQMGRDAALRDAAQRCVIASIGPICSEAIRRHGLSVDVEPAHPHMGSLLAEAARASRDLLSRKRGTA